MSISNDVPQRSFTIRAKERDVPGTLLGANLPPLLDVIIGVTPGETSVESEFAKAITAVDLGIGIVTDVSTSGNADLRRRIASELPVSLRTVPTYDIYRAARAGEDAASAVRRVIKQHIADGADSITIHATGTPNGAIDEKVARRVIPVTSRGGAMMNEVAESTAGINPYVVAYEDILRLCTENEVTLCLATTARPGSVVDALDPSHLAEIDRQAELVRQAHQQGVAVIVELMGHTPLDRISEYCHLATEKFDGAPFGALGPCVTDVAMGHDDVSGAIGAAVAAMSGATFIACLTAGEHSHLPTHDELVRSIKSFQVALHAGWIARSGDLTQDRSMSVARNANDWPAMVANSLHPVDAQGIVDVAGYHSGQVCSMCGSSCPIVKTNAVLNRARSDGAT